MNFGLDTRTLLLTGAIVCLLLGAISLVFGRLADSRSMRCWGWAGLTLTAGSACLGLRGVAPDFVSIGIGNVLLMIAMVLLNRSLRIVRGAPTGDVLGWTLVIGTGFVSLFFLYVSPNFTLRIAWFSAVGAFILIRAAWFIASDAETSTRQAQRLIGASLFIIGLAHAIRAVEALSSGGNSGLLEPSATTAMMLVSLQVCIIGSTLGMMWMEMQRMRADLLQHATHDHLTGLLNRNAFLDDFSREVSRCQRASGTFGLAIFDVDNFKRFNDTYGHQVGDEVLCMVVDVLRESVRTVDVLGRYGGEEFALIMPGADLDAAVRVADRARLNVEARGRRSGRELSLTISAGVAVYGRHGTSWDSMLSAADSALYDAKHAGRNQVCCAKDGPVALARSFLNEGTVPEPPAGA